MRADHDEPLWRPLRSLVIASAYVASAGILVMALVTCVDIVLRRFGTSVTGAYDVVRLAGGVTIASALPLTTAVKGHVAIEYFFHRLGRGWRMAVDSVMRTVQCGLFLFAAYAFHVRATRLFRSGEVMPTLQCPTYPLAWYIAAMCLLTAFVSLFHLVRPGRDLMRPPRRTMQRSNSSTDQRTNGLTDQRTNGPGGAA
ncbi:MAG: TRAP transporter small permease [Kiritimatiellae bacterium]|nr:TRAP transporter small permease [Kiritimatiellia bacterium]